jgi:hypothetical protein
MIVAAIVACLATTTGACRAKVGTPPPPTVDAAKKIRPWVAPPSCRPLKVMVDGRPVGTLIAGVAWGTATDLALVMSTRDPGTCDAYAQRRVKGRSFHQRGLQPGEVSVAGWTTQDVRGVTFTSNTDPKAASQVERSLAGPGVHVDVLTTPRTLGETVQICVHEVTIPIGGADGELPDHPSATIDGMLEGTYCGPVPH